MMIDGLDRAFVLDVGETVVARLQATEHAMRGPYDVRQLTTSLLVDGVVYKTLEPAIVQQCKLLEPGTALRISRFPDGFEYVVERA